MTRYRNGWELNPKSKRGNNNPQQDKRGHTNTERPFFLRIYRKGKGNNTNTQRITKTMQEDKERQRDERMQTQEQKDKKEDKIEDKKEDKRGQNRGKHATSHITA